MSEYKSLVELFSSSDRWCQGHIAEDRSHLPCSPRSEEAVSWCLVGGVQTVYVDEQIRRDVFAKLDQKLREKADYLALSVWNDKVTHKEILEVVKELNI